MSAPREALTHRPTASPVNGSTPGRLLARAGGRSLVTRVFVANAAVVTVAVLIIALSPARIPSPTSPLAVAVLAAGLGAVLLVNYALLRRALAPLDRLARTMADAGPLEPGMRASLGRSESDVLGLTAAFNRMLNRLEEERRLSVRRSLRAQESERLRVARELHDEVGQTLTAVLLHLDRLRRSSPAGFAADIEEVTASARESLSDVRAIAHRLRPEPLEDLGLRAALGSLCARVSEQGGSAWSAAWPRSCLGSTPNGSWSCTGSPSRP